MQDEQDIIKVPLSSLPSNKGKLFFSSFDNFSSEFQKTFNKPLRVSGSVSNNPLHRRESLKGEAFDIGYKERTSEEQKWIEENAPKHGIKFLKATGNEKWATGPHYHLQESDEIRIPLEKVKTNATVATTKSIQQPSAFEDIISQHEAESTDITKKLNKILPQPSLRTQTLPPSTSLSSKKSLGRYEGYSKIGEYAIGVIEKSGIVPTTKEGWKHLGGLAKNTLAWMTDDSIAGRAWSDPNLARETIPGAMIEAQLSPLQQAETLRKQKGLGVIESWTDPEILGHSGLALIPYFGPLASTMSTEIKEGRYKEASQSAIAMALPFLHQKLVAAKDSGKIKGIKIEESKTDSITSYDDSSNTIYINPLKIQEEIAKGKNPAAAIEEGINHELGHSIVDSPTPEQKLLLKKSADKVLKPKEAEVFKKEVDNGKEINRNTPKLYKSEEKVVEDITTTGEALKSTRDIENEQTLAKRVEEEKAKGYEAIGPDLSSEGRARADIELEAKGFPKSNAPAIEEGLPVRSIKAEEGDISIPLESLPKGEEGKITPQLANAMSLGLGEFTKQDLAGGISKGFKMAKEALNLLSPRTGVPKAGLDLMMEMKGKRELEKAKLGLRMEEVKKAFEKSPQQENIEFMDRIKTGQPQGSSELQDVANFYRKLDDNVYSEINKERSKANLKSTTYLDNHFRIFWKEIPGSTKPSGITNTLKNLFLSKRPLQGTKGFLKQHTLTDVTEGIQKGGVPVSYNPQTLMELSYADSYKYLTALRMWNGLKDIGLRQFIKKGDSIPEGFRPISDPIAQVYFPAELASGKTTLMKGGQWVVEDNVARILENHLSRDYIRESEIGNTMVDIKNTLTMAELGFSGFHATFEGLESIGSQIALGLRQMANIGIRGEPKYLAKGLATSLKSPIAPFTQARLGGSVIRYIKNPEEFIKTTRGDSFVKAFPNAKDLINDLFIGGAQLKMDKGYRTQWYQGMKDAYKEGNYPGSLLRSPLAVAEKMMLPLFDTYIPRLKLGSFLQEYSTALVENKKALAKDKMTRPELARKTWDFVEDRFGEMNFDNLWWDKTLKTANQTLFRSVTWKLGNLRATLGSVPEQAISGVKSIKAGEFPMLTPKMSWLAGMSLVTSVAGVVAAKGYSGKYPWEWAMFNPDGTKASKQQEIENLTKEIIFPRVSSSDSSKRISTPTYWKDVFHLQHDPKGYINSSMSSFITKIADTWQNKDFSGAWVYNPNDPLTKEAIDVGQYFFPVPFSVQGFMQGKDRTESAQSLFGITKAPFYIREPEKERVFKKIEEIKQTKKKIRKESK